MHTLGISRSQLLIVEICQDKRDIELKVHQPSTEIERWELREGKDEKVEIERQMGR